MSELKNIDIVTGNNVKSSSNQNFTRDSSISTNIEKNAELQAGAEKINMMYADPNAEFLYGLARTMAQTNASKAGGNDFTKIKLSGSLDKVNPSEMNSEELLNVYKEKV